MIESGLSPSKTVVTVVQYLNLHIVRRPVVLSKGRRAALLRDAPEVTSEITEISRRGRSWVIPWDPRRDAAFRAAGVYPRRVNRTREPGLNCPASGRSSSITVAIRL